MIVDTNVLIQIFTNPNLNTEAFITNEKFEAPEYIKLELINVFRKIHFLNNIPISTLDDAYNNAIDLIYIFHPDQTLIDEAKIMSYDLNHPIYDCLFLSLASKTQLPFVSSDKRLIAKANAIGIEGLLFDDLINY